MADEQKKEENLKGIPSPENKELSSEQTDLSRKEQEKILEKKEIAKEEQIISDELRREIELMDIDDNLKKQAEQKANKISFLADDDKLKKLLDIAREKGLIFAIQVAKRMNDPFILDTLHDALAKEGYYKDFTK